MKPIVLFTLFFTAAFALTAALQADKPASPPLDPPAIVLDQPKPPAIPPQACLPGKPCLLVSGSDAPSIPSELLAAIQAVEADKASLASSGAAVAAATKALQTASEQLAATTALLAKDKAAMQTIWDRLYPPEPSPTPPPTPQPPAPQPPAPTPDVVSLLLVSGTKTATWFCPACDKVQAESVPALQTQLGDKFKRVEWSQAGTDFPQGAKVPYWILTRNGKTETHEGYLTLPKLQAWIAGLSDPNMPERK